MQGENYRRRLKSLLLYLGFVFQALISSLCVLILLLSISEMFLPSRQIQNMTDEKSDADTDNYPQNFNSKLFYKRPTDLTILSKGSIKTEDQLQRRKWEVTGAEGRDGGREEKEYCQVDMDTVA